MKNNDILSQKLEYVEYYNKPNETTKCIVLWLHGLGADGNDFLPVAHELDLAVATHYIFPHASYRTITINNDYTMRGWFNIRSLDWNGVFKNVDYDGIIESVNQIDMLIKDLLAEGFKSEQIILAGFSQGGVVSYFSALLLDYKFAGVIALSTYFPYDYFSETVRPTRANESTNFMICHGNADNVVPLQLADISYHQLKELGFVNSSWHAYEMAHNVCAKELIDISEFINKCVR